MFGCLFPILRSAASLILGLVIFFGFLGILLTTNLRDNFLTTEFYTENISDNNAYDRFYNKVLLDTEFEDTTDELLGDVHVPGEDIVKLVREILPPEYLQDQVEGAIQGAIEYLNKKTDTPEVFLDLGPPLEQVKPALFGYIDRRIDGLEEVPVTTFEELETELESLFRTVEMGEIPTRVPSIADPNALVSGYVDQQIAALEERPVRTTDEFEAELEKVYEDLGNGEIPATVPSLDAIPVSQRTAAFDNVLSALRSDLSIPEEAIKGLENREQEIKEQLRLGSVKGALEVATEEVTAPVVEEFVDDSYDEVFQTLSRDRTFPRNALEGLDRERAQIKRDLGAGEIKSALKVGGHGLVGPLIDAAVGELRKDLDDQDRLDLIAKAAEQNDQSKEEFLDDLDLARDIIDQSGAGFWLGILMMTGGVILMVAVHLPHFSSGLRWPGVTLFFSGLVFLLIGLVLKSILPGRFDNLLDKADVSPIPPTMVQIVSDVLSSMASDVAGGFIVPSIAVMVIGLVMLAASFVIRLLHIPFISR